MTKSVSTACILISFIGMAGFGFLAMSPEGDMHGCIAALTRGGECPAGSDIFASLSFHAGAIKGFSTATVAAGLFAVFFLFSTFVLAFIHRNDEGVAAPFLVSYSRYKQEVRFFASPLRQRILRWFSLHENSPVAS